MNYIKHLNQWMELSYSDERLTPHHLSIYMTLFQFWNRSRFSDSFVINRSDIFQGSKVGSTRTYYKCIKELHEFGYIIYSPSKCAMKGSRISVIPLDEVKVIEETGCDESPENDTLSAHFDKGICDENSPDTTAVPNHNVHNRSIKNDTCGNHQVIPLLINNINLVNSKERESRAHARPNNFDFKKAIPEGKRDDVALNDKCLKKVSLQSLDRPQPELTSSSAAREVSKKKEFPRQKSNPSLSEVTDFFVHKLNGNYENTILQNLDRNAEAFKFFHYYEARGWLINGKIPMKNWKRACRSWVAKIPFYSKWQGENLSIS